jgi:hypothetical protein
MPGSRSRLALGLLIAAPLLTDGAAFASPEPARLSLVAGRADDSLQVDGRLDEPAWASAPAIDGLTMVEPRQGDKPSQRTEVRVLASPEALWFGVRCFDEEPAKIVGRTLERDGDLESEDYLLLVLDPFQDGRSGYIFAVNPRGARLDGFVDPGGEDADTAWDAEWEAAAVRDESGWVAEIRIPVRSLGFKRGLSEWGLNVARQVQRLQEIDRWSGARQDLSPFQTSRAGLLSGLPAFDLGWGLGVRPALVGGFNRPAADAPADGRLEPSLDVTQRLGSNVLGSLTINTDFAETEVDARQTNLTRFPLYYPEKRTFFLDGGDIFAFGAGIDGESLLPFFSRRIGLVEGREVPILAGIKTTGRIGQTNVGALAVRTRELEGVAPATTMGVLRLRQNVLAESRAGIIATAGDPFGRSGSWELGADFTYQTSRFRGDKNFSVGVWGLVTERDGLEGDTSAFGLKLDYPNDLWDCRLVYRHIGDGFDPSLGFVPRRGIEDYNGGCTFAPRPKSGPIRQMFFELSPRLTTDLDGRWESYGVFVAPLILQLESGDSVFSALQPEGERLVAPFEIAEGVVIPPGSYEWTRYGLELETASKRLLAVEVEGWFGGFYSGTLTTLGLELAITPSPIVTFFLSAERNDAELAEGRFRQTLFGGKLRLNLSPDLQLNSFVQYDSEDGSIGSNTRLRWTFHPRGDVFLVYNHNLREIQDRWQRDSNELLVKAQYTFRR